MTISEDDKIKVTQPLYGTGSVLWTFLTHYRNRTSMFSESYPRTTEVLKEDLHRKKKKEKHILQALLALCHIAQNNGSFRLSQSGNSLPHWRPLAATPSDMSGVAASLSISISMWQSWNGGSNAVSWQVRQLFGHVQLLKTPIPIIFLFRTREKIKRAHTHTETCWKHHPPTIGAKALFNYVAVGTAFQTSAVCIELAKHNGQGQILHPKPTESRRQVAAVNPLDPGN